jgi:hypothetical protein
MHEFAYGGTYYGGRACVSSGSSVMVRSCAKSDSTCWRSSASSWQKSKVSQLTKRALNAIAVTASRSLLTFDLLFTISR